MSATTSVELQACLDTAGFTWLDDFDAGAGDVAAQLGRPGRPERLTPAGRSDAAAWSLSGTYGLDAFPWHTDGAISSDPPRWLLLRAVELSDDATWTELLVPGPELLAALRRTVLRATDRGGRVRYLPAAVPGADGRHRLRWDPRTCTPRAGVAVDEVERWPPSARVAWRPGRLLVIDNARVLHRRPSVAAHTIRVLERTYVWSS